MERMLNDEITSQVRQVFGEMIKEPVKILFFESKENCEFCEKTKQLLEEITPLHDSILLDTFDIARDPEMATKYRVDKTPAIVLAGMNGETEIDYGIRFYGIPAGHEFTSLINDIILVSQQDSGLKPETREFLQGIEKEIHLQVFVTPT